MFNLQQRHNGRHVHCASCGSWTWSSAGCLLATILCLMTQSVLSEVIYRVDPLALLAATLRTYQRAGCDSEQLSLSCPRGTSISIELAQYGRAGDLTDHSLCPPVAQEELTTFRSAGDAAIHSSTEIEVKPPEMCTVSGLQYALLQTVVDACQKKRHCKFAANSRTHTSEDPCLGIRKFVEIAYKCRPYEFRSKTACENDNMPLVCNPYSRIAIYSASFGHTERESAQCGGQEAGSAPTTNDDNSKPTCLVSYATETVMQICHGRRRCSVTADAGTFGRPCKTNIRMYLKVVYTCSLISIDRPSIPRKVLKDRYETASEVDELQQNELDMDQDELYDEDQFYKESEAIPPAPKLQGAIPNSGLHFDFNSVVNTDGVTSTLLPPLLSHSDGSLEEKLEASKRLLNRIKVLLNRELTTENITTDTVAVITTMNTVAPDGSTTQSSEITDDNDKDNLEKRDPDLDAENPLLASGIENFFMRRKCQSKDDWGPIGLNCTEKDTIVEHVKVIGFLSNWLQTYLHIRKHQEQFYLYLIISVAAGVLLCLTLVIGRLVLQKRRNERKNSNSSNSEAPKAFSEVTGNLAIGSSNSSSGPNKRQQTTTDKTHLPDSFGDDISDSDADVDLTGPLPLPSLSSPNEAYMTYAPIPSCTYGDLPDTRHHPVTSGTSTVLVASSQASPHGGLLLSGQGKFGQTMISTGFNGRQPTPPATIYTSMGHPIMSAAGTLTMGTAMIGSTGLGTPSYLNGTVMLPGHHHTHAGTLRRTNAPMHPASSSGVYYDSTVPRSLVRGMSADNSAQYFYG